MIIFFPQTLARFGRLQGFVLKGSKRLDFFELFAIAVGLSMDAFAVSICKGLSAGKAQFKNAMCVGFYFGFFQFLMPVIGYFISSFFSSLLSTIAAYIAFLLLAVIGGNMIREACSAKEDTDEVDNSFSPKSMFPLAIATSIDALATGVAFSAMQVKIFPSCGLIGVTTFVLSAIGLYVGSIFGNKFEKKAQITGGIILILIGLKILIENFLK